jgi:D-alanyl-D-alanine carboxypeptidase
VNRRAVAVTLVLVASACSQSTPTPRAGSLSTTTRVIPTTAGERAEIRVNAAALGAIADRYRSSCKSPGAAIALRTSDGRDHFALSGRLAPGIALDRDTQFLAGSVTKLFVATVAYQLIEAHRLALGDTVERYLPGWPRGNRITIAMLLGHRSGMGDFGNDFGKQLTDLVLSDLNRDFSYGEVLDLVRTVPPVAPPGTTYHYSNANYIVLGAILERVSGMKLGRLIDARIIEPLRLSRTLYGPDDLVVAGRVVFHGLFDVTGTGTPIDIGAFPRNAALTVDPAGAGLFSSLPDLLAFTRALFASNTLLAGPQRSALARSVSTLNAKALLLDDRFAIVGHGGASPGAQTIVAYDRTSATTVAVWCNRLDPGVNELLASVIAAKDTFELAAR